MEDLERAENRLDNIRTVEPILSALRTISLGSWQAALKRRDGARLYAERLAVMLPALSPHIPSLSSPKMRGKEGGTRVVTLVVGSERGLCGRFNAAIVEQTERYLAEQETAGVRVELVVMGKRAARILQKREEGLVSSAALPAAGLPPSRLAFDLTRRWLARYEEHELDAVDLIYNAYQGTGRYEPAVVRLIPSTLPTSEAAAPPWPPIIETDPASLYTRVVEQWSAVRLYELLLDSAAAEHSARFQLMEAATQNAERLIDELTLALQTARQQAITQEMQELAVGAGLIGPR
ncbi:MAG: FoF1 ATP synthase subunit gamma [Chloroflexota bacterium]|nr:FoF1 ATP synthase subunit gamma [Chloroflexota bacterium]